MVKKGKGKRLKDLEDDETEIVVGEDGYPSDVEALLGELGSGDFNVTVYKLNESKGTWDKVRTYPLDQFNPDVIADNYGGGKYRIKVTNPDGTYVKQTVISYAERVKLPDVPATAIPKDETQKEMVSLLREELKSTKEEQKATSVAMIQMVSKVLEAQMSASQKPQANTIDEVTKVVNLLGLKNKDNPMENVTAVMNLLRDGINMGKDMSITTGDNKPEDIILMKLAEQLLPALSKLGKVNPQAQNVLTQIPQIPQVPQIPSIPETPRKEIKTMEYKTENERIVIGVLKDNSAGLINCAKLGSDPMFVINFIDTKLKDEDIDKLVDYFSHEENFERTLEFIPEFKSYPDWFKNLSQCILNFYLGEQNENGRSTEDKSGEQPDTGNNAEVNTNSPPAKD